jgi:hypothetical protein
MDPLNKTVGSHDDHQNFPIKFQNPTTEVKSADFRIRCQECLKRRNSTCFSHEAWTNQYSPNATQAERSFCELFRVINWGQSGLNGTAIYPHSLDLGTWSDDGEKCKELMSRLTAGKRSWQPWNTGWITILISSIVVFVAGNPGTSRVYPPVWPPRPLMWR